MTTDHVQHSLPAAGDIVSNVPASFAWRMLTRHHPELIATVRQFVPFD